MLIILERNRPLTLLQTEALLRRYPKELPEYVYFEERFLREQTGYAGELKVDREWGRFRLPSDYFLLHGLQIMDLGFYSHQMDTVFLNPYFALVLEIKNISGKISMNEDTSQFIREREDGKLESFYNPVDQVQRHAYCLKVLFKDMGYSLPIIYAVVWANSAAILLMDKKLPVFHLSALQRKLLEYYQRYPQHSLDTESVKKLAFALKKMHEPRLLSFQYDTSQLICGVICEKCGQQQVMRYRYGGFECSNCLSRDRDGIAKGIADYRLLIKDTISNQEFREYFGIESRNVAGNILSSYKWSYTGSFRNRRYHIPLEVLYKHHK